MDIRMSNIATPMPQIRARFTSKLGIPLSGCKVYTYEPNSNIPKTTWIDIDKTVENTNPILLDAAGEADIFLDGLYQIVVKDRFGFTVYDVEKIGYEQPIFNDGLLLTWSGRTQADKNRDFMTVEDYGAIGDGVLHPLSEKYATLALAKFAYANIADRIVSLEQSIDWAACQSAVVANNTTYAAAKKYSITDTITIPDGHNLLGQGTDYYDFYRPNTGNLKRSDASGTHFYLHGAGAKVHELFGFSNTLDARIIDGKVMSFSKLTNEDSINGAPATARKLSIGMIVGRNSRVSDFRVIPYFDGINGYNDATTTQLGSNWDVGVWVVGANGARLDTIQSVGYYRVAGWLLTESKGLQDSELSYGKRNPERTIFNNCMGTGVRGLLVRNLPQYQVTANTPTTVTIKSNSSSMITGQSKFKTDQSNAIEHTFTGYTHNSGDSTTTLTGVSPQFTQAPVTIRSPNMGNNFSNTIFRDCVFGGLEHTNGYYDTLGLPISAAAEYDGYPLRNIVHINTAFTADRDEEINTLWGNAYDLKYIGCKHENGYMIAYSHTESNMYTMNLRFVAEDVVTSTSKWDLPYFNPRSSYNDSQIFPQTFTDGSLSIQAPKGRALKIIGSDGEVALEVSSTGLVKQKFTGSFSVFDAISNTSRLLITPTSISTNVSLSTAESLTVGANTIVSGVIRPNTDNTSTLGTPTYRFSTIYAATGAISTSDERLKQQFKIQSESEKLAAIEIKNSICLFRFNDAVDLKGDGARWHVGVKAQQVISILESHGLNAFDYGFICFDEWDEQEEIIETWGDEFNENGDLIREAGSNITQEYREAGSRYGIRYDELSMFILAAI